MNLSAVNWLAVVVCTLVNMVSGAIWYNPKTFFPVWWRGIGKTDQDQPGGGNMNITWGLTIFAAFVQAVAMALMVNAMGGMMGGVSAVTGAATGFMLWLGFVAPTSLVNKLFAGHGLKIWAIEVGNHLINLVLLGAILGAWQA